MQLAKSIQAEQLDLLTSNLPFVSSYYQSCNNDVGRNVTGWQQSLQPIFNTIAAIQPNGAGLWYSIGSLQLRGFLGDTFLQMQIGPDAATARSVHSTPLWAVFLPALLVILSPIYSQYEMQVYSGQLIVPSATFFRDPIKATAFKALINRYFTLIQSALPVGTTPAQATQVTRYVWGVATEFTFSYPAVSPLVQNVWGFEQCLMFPELQRPENTYTGKSQPFWADYSGSTTTESTEDNIPAPDPVSLGFSACVLEKLEYYQTVVRAVFFFCSITASR